jgi:glycosyltransferase involved in cell wall biosynthesis
MDFSRQKKFLNHLNNTMKVFCVIPALNEEKNIGFVINQVKKLVDKVIVVDDGSKDNTQKLAHEAGAVVLKHLINRGQGAALETGNQYCVNNQADIIVHFDADNQFMAQEILDVIKPIKENEADIVFGSRFLTKKSKMPYFKKHLIMPLAKLINSFLGIKTSDPQSGFRAFNLKTAKLIKIENDGMAHCSEILYKAFYYKLRIKEVPITVIYHEFGNNFSGGFRIIKDLFIRKIIK